MAESTPPLGSAGPLTKRRNLTLLLVFGVVTFNSAKYSSDLRNYASGADAKRLSSDTNPVEMIHQGNATTVASTDNDTLMLRIENEQLRRQVKALEEVKEILILEREVSQKKDEEADTTETSKQEVTPAPKVNVNYALEHSDMDMFEKHGCYPVRDICTTGHQWFYHSKARNTLAYQPNFSVRHELHIKHGIPEEIAVNNSFFYKRDWEKQPGAPKGCKMSDIPNHVIVTSFYMTMAMEAYYQVVGGFWKLWRALDAPWWKETPTSPHTQFYSLARHRYTKQGAESETNIMPSLHALMAGFTSHPLQNYMELHDQTKGCQCFERLIFCGFSDWDEWMIKEEKKKMRRDPTYNSTILPTIPTKPPIKHLHPADRVGKKGDPEWDPLRKHVRKGGFDAYPSATGRAAELKQNAIFGSLQLLNQTYDPTEIAENLKDWTLVGFAQRSTRRRWLNLDQTLELCRKNYLLQHKVVCVQLNLDTPAGGDPENQVVMHAGLDAMIGVHGSQNVHSVWMPDGSYSLEILPHLVADWGGWTRHTHKPTVNGEMLANTKLNHVGYPLNESSIPNCTEWKDVERCNSAIKWDSRDFLVPQEVIDSFIQKFLILPSGTVTTSPLKKCENFEDLSRKEFVLYNVNCIEDSEPTKKQYYRERTTFAHLEKRRM